MHPANDSELVALRERSERTFRTPYNGLPVTVAPEFGDHAISSVQSTDPDLDGGNPNATFSVFDVGHQDTALAMTAEFMATVAERPDADGLTAVLDAADAALATQNSDLVKYALAVFVTNDDTGRNLYIPPPVRQSPEQFLPSHPGVSPASEAMGGLGDEARLDYFREDPDYNTHHGQWHIVYPARGVPNAQGQRVLKSRQGELFWYMHQQMLARYDTERIAVTGTAAPMLPVQAYADYRAAVGEGYVVEDVLGERFDDRPPNRKITSVVLPLNQAGTITVTVAEMEAHRDRIKDGIANGFATAAGPVVLTPDVRGANLLGATLEATIGTVALPGDVALGGGLHNLGHGFFSALSGGNGGVMQATSTAVRDPVFYRWHRHIDDLFVSWQKRLPENDLAAGAPPVTIRKDADGVSSDIGLALLRDLAPGTDDGTEFDGAAFGAATFGGDRWDTPIAQCPGGNLTTQLETTIGNYDLVTDTGDQFRIFHLDHAEFAYFFRLENRSDQPQQVTVRVFLVSAEHADDRRWWIEMDKFLQPLAAHERAVLYRPARLSSVVRKKARRPQEPPPGPAEANDDYCKCGWAYHMLVPRGRPGPDGMPFRLLVMATDAVADLADAEGKCGSLSFCGARDARYPDNRLMGYPFDRPFTSRTIGATIADPALTHLGGLDFSIRHIPEV